MDFLLRSRKSILLLTAAAGLTAYGAHRFKISKLAGALFSLADTVSSTAEIASLLSGDLNTFIRSDSDEIPSSLKQLSKIAVSDELAGSVSRVSEALMAGIARAIQSRDANSSYEMPGLPDRILDKLFSTAGSNFSSVVAGSAARNLVIAFYSRSAEGASIGPQSPPAMAWVDFVCSEKCRELIADSIHAFVGTAVAVFLDKTMHINTYNELFAGLTNPRHQARVKEMLVSVCNGATETLVRTSHRVLTSSGPCLSVNRAENFRPEGANLAESGRKTFRYPNKGESCGWVSQVSSTLAVPSNRKFVLDVTGRVTFETVRSVIEFSMEKVSDGVNGMSSLGQGVAERGLKVMRYLSARSIVIATLCFILCMHVLAGTRGLMQV